MITALMLIAMLMLLVQIDFMTSSASAMQASLEMDAITAMPCLLKTSVLLERTRVPKWEEFAKTRSTHSAVPVIMALSIKISRCQAHSVKHAVIVSKYLEIINDGSSATIQ